MWGGGGGGLNKTVRGSEIRLLQPQGIPWWTRPSGNVSSISLMRSPIILGTNSEHTVTI